MIVLQNKNKNHTYVHKMISIMEHDDAFGFSIKMRALFLAPKSSLIEIILADGI